MAERCLQWIDKHGDMDGYGFQEYQRRAPGGADTQGRRDAGNGIPYADGGNVPDPKAPCDLQGYIYAAWLGMAAIFEALGRLTVYVLGGLRLRRPPPGLAWAFWLRTGSVPGR